MVAGLRDGAPPDEVWVSANDGEFDTTPLNFLDSAERYLLWHKRSLFRLGIPAGVQPIRPGAQAIPPDGALLAKDDGTWEVVPSPGALSGLPLYSPPDDCRLLNEGAIEPWPEVPPFSNAARTGPTTTLLGGDDGVLYHFNPQSGAEALADLGSPVRAVAYDGAGRAYALDARYRLHSVPLEGGAATVIQTSTANLGLAATSTTWTMAQLAVGSGGLVHLITQYLDFSTTKALFQERLARLSGAEWVRWNDPECGPQEPRLDDGYTSHRLVTTSDGSVVAVGNCRRVIVRWRNAWGYEFVLSPTVVRELRGRSYVGTKNGGLFDDRDRSGEWGSIITAGGRGVQDMAEAPRDGILVAEFNNSQTVTKVVYPPLPGAVMPQLCPLQQIAWPGGTTELLLLGDQYLVRTANPVAVWRFSLGSIPD
ncbi:MAG: hypothetical protein IPG45_37695 [Deltaproteobacteria bacterium]|nr:hypothetical protein [Deltaproteobacteria bacterium]